MVTARPRTRRAGVSSYGVGGTIAHLILEESPLDPAPPAPTTSGTADRTPAVYPISSMSEAGLRGLAGATADWLADNPGVPLSSVRHTLALRRSLGLLVKEQEDLARVETEADSLFAMATR